MTQRIIEWPATLRPGAQEWGLLQPMVSSTSAFSGATFDKLIGPPRWAFSMDLPDAPASMLPQIEAALRQMRGGLNLLRIGDLRRTGRQSAAPGAERWPLNLLPWSGQMLRWGIAGPQPVAEADGALKLEQAGGIATFTAEPMRAGFRYIVAAEVVSDVSANASFSISAGPVGQPMGAIFNTVTGEVVARYGPMMLSMAKTAQGWKFWAIVDCVRDAQPQVQLHALMATSDRANIRFSRPVVALATSGVPPTYVETAATPAYAEVSVVVDGAGQAGDSLRTIGWIPGSKIRVGSWINYGDGLHQVLSAVTVGGDGAAQLWIEPPIRRSPDDGAPVSVRNVTGLFKLKTAPRVRQEGMVARGLTLEFEECLQ